MSAWLPDSYPTAPAPVTAVFAGLLTKVGVYAIIRTQTVLFPDSPLTGLLLWAALATMVVGILGAIAQSEIKRMLSFTLVSHIGYMIFGIGLASVSGYAGAIFYTAHHITIQTTLFLVTGLIETRGGSTSLNELGGLAAASPVLGILFFVPAMNLGRHPAAVRLRRQGRAAGGRRRDRRLPAVPAGRRLGGHQPAHPLRDGQGLEPSVLAAASAEPDALELVAGEEDTGADRAAAHRHPGDRSVGRLPVPMVATATVLVLLGVGITVVVRSAVRLHRALRHRHRRRIGLRPRRAAGGDPVTRAAAPRGAAGPATSASPPWSC